MAVVWIVIGAIFRCDHFSFQAIDEPSFSVAYANMCKCMIQVSEEISKINRNEIESINIR